MEKSIPMKPHRPTHIPAYAEICLQALVANGLNDKISLGGAFGLLHYLDYRPTHDVDALCQNGLTTPEQCWQLWQQRQKLAGSDTDTYRARLAVETHLTRIALYRPLDQISDPDQRAEAEQVRSWFGGEFLDALVD
jgi:hypothetical protein